MTNDTSGTAGEDIPTSAVLESAGRAAEPMRRLNHVVCFGIGLVAALLGLLPWLASGMRLPLQNLWATNTLPEAMPVALLPLSQYSTTLIPGLLITGAGAAGLVARLLRPRLARRGTVLITVAVFLVFAIAGVQASIVVADGLERSDAAEFYLTALMAVTIISITMAVLVLLLAARAPVPGATIALSVAAIAAGIWLNSLLAPFGSTPSEATMWLLGLARWVPAILVGFAIAWCGVRSVGRIAAVLVSLVALWIGPAAITAVSAATGTRVLLQYPSEMLDYGIGVFSMAAGLPELVLPPILVALTVAVLTVLASRLVRRLNQRVVTR
ncbi:MAG: hypothetical protein M3116_02565 [Actinomycetota bacterium]|nr:hypothetical protein [Actinomycetota bacterium]